MKRSEEERKERRMLFALGRLALVLRAEDTPLSRDLLRQLGESLTPAREADGK